MEEKTKKQIKKDEQDNFLEVFQSLKKSHKYIVFETLRKMEHSNQSQYVKDLIYEKLQQRLDENKRNGIHPGSREELLDQLLKLNYNVNDDTYHSRWRDKCIKPDVLAEMLHALGGSSIKNIESYLQKEVSRISNMADVERDAYADQLWKNSSSYKKKTDLIRDIDDCLKDPKKAINKAIKEIVEQELRTEEIPDIKKRAHFLYVNLDELEFAYNIPYFYQTLYEKDKQVIKYLADALKELEDNPDCYVGKPDFPFVWID